MKEAAGQANITVITIVLIGFVAGVGLMIVPKLMENSTKQACCTDAAGIWADNTCKQAGDIPFKEEDYIKCISKS